MKLRVELGYSGYKKEFNWWKPLDDFPHVVSHNGVKWEWAVYDTDKTKVVDYVLIFTDIPTNKPSYSSIVAEDLNMLTRDTSGNNCECGAIYSDFKWDHMRFCPKWTKW